VDIPATSENIPGTLVLRASDSTFSARAITVQNEGPATLSAERVENGFGSGAVQMRKARGSLSSLAAVVADDRLGWLRFWGHDGVNYIEGARITAEVDGTPGSNDMPGRLSFSTTPDGSATPTERIRIDSTGNVGIGTTANAVAILDVASTTKGFLPPRMTTTERNAIVTPPAGLMVYNTTTNKLNFYNGTAWEAVTSA
jgi:hypothetical protein